MEGQWAAVSAGAGDGVAAGPLERDLYEVLGIEPAASPPEITSAYRRLVRELHPDSRLEAGTADAAGLGDVLAAYQVLRDPQQRASYDDDRRRRAAVNRPGGIPIPVRHVQESPSNVDGMSLLVGPVRFDPQPPPVRRSGIPAAGSAFPPEVLRAVEALLRRWA